MRDATCSCGATPARAGTARRLALAYARSPWRSRAHRRSRRRARRDTGDLAVRGSPRPRCGPLGSDAWSPAEFSDAALAAHLGARALEAAKVARSRGLLARVRLATRAEPAPTIALPSCTVRFLVPHALAFARCDCQLGEACPHVALAVWAAQKAGTAIEGERTIELAAAAGSRRPCRPRAAAGARRAGP